MYQVPLSWKRIEFPCVGPPKRIKYSSLHLWQKDYKKSQRKRRRPGGILLFFPLSLSLKFVVFCFGVLLRLLPRKMRENILCFSQCRQIIYCVRASLTLSALLKLSSLNSLTRFLSASPSVCDIMAIPGFMDMSWAPI